MSAGGEKIEAYMTALNGTTRIQYSFSPKSEDFVRPHIIRVREQTVWIGEIANTGGVLWRMEIKESNETMRMTSAELYGSSGYADDESSLLIFALMFAAIAVAGFVAFMRYRDVSESNGLVDRTVCFWCFKYNYPCCLGLSPAPNFRGPVRRRRLR